MTELPSHDRKATSDGTMIFISDQRNKGENLDYCSHHFQTTSIFLIVFVMLILRLTIDIEIDGFNRPQRESDIRYEFDLKVVLKGLECK